MMFEILPVQLHLALFGCYCGLFGGLLYDVLHPLRKKNMLCPAADALFCLVSFGSLTLCHIMLGEERLRIAAFFFYAVGFGLYRIGIGQGIRFLFRLISGRKKA